MKKFKNCLSIMRFQSLSCKDGKVKHTKSGVLYVSLSFDDGYASNYNMAKYLSAIGIKATFFITTNFKEELFLPSTPERIVEMSHLGHEIGSHTCTHPNFLRSTRSEREYELKESKKWLENIVRKKIRSFAYPFFLYNEKVLQDTHKFYPVSRSRHLHVGSHEVDTFEVHFVTRKNVLSILINTIFKDKIDYALIVLHDLNLFQIALLLSSLKVLTQVIPRQIRFVTMSELADLMIKNSKTTI